MWPYLSIRKLLLIREKKAMDMRWNQPSFTAKRQPFSFMDDIIT
jgi:hypothetical protein